MRVRDITLTAALWMLTSGAVMAYEEPAYSVVAADNGVEYRRYETFLVAETTVAGTADRDQATSIGFRRLFDYISGANTLRETLSPPVSIDQQPEGTKIAMTTPVRHIPTARGWSVAFVVPSEFDEASVPRPTNPEVRIRTIPGELVAVLKYSGRWTDENVAHHTSELVSRLAEAGIAPLGEVVTAYYNAPFSLPFTRRNEVMVAVRSAPGPRAL